MSSGTADSYDEVPYINRAFPQSHPDRMATLAKLFGVVTPELDTCRVLELGSASGANLIPMALTMPRAQFVGIDLSRRQTEEGQAIVRSLQLANIELRQADITSVDASYGQFDYIICHGIYSWVPPAVREKLLDICHANLSPQGVAYVSYNTLPGWHMRGMLRDMMQYHTRHVADPATKTQQARAIVDFLAENVHTESGYGRILRAEREAMRAEADAYLFHDFLEDENHPVYFHEFAQAASGHGLQYMAEAVFNWMLVSTFSKQVGETLSRIAPDVLGMEQYIDFLRGRSFRQTLLIHEGIRVSRQLDARVMSGFYITSLAQASSPTPSVAQGVSETFRAPNGAAIGTSNAITKAALLLLRDRWPLGLTFEQLVAASRSVLAGTNAEMLPFAQDAHVLGNDLLQSYAADILELRIKAPPLTLTPSSFPVASPLARLQALHGATVTNLRHEAIRLDDFGLCVLSLLDGTRDRDGIAMEIGQRLVDGKVRVPQLAGDSIGGADVSSPAA